MGQADGLRFSRDHEWVRIENGQAVVGISDYAQDQLGDIVFIDLPTPGRQVTAGEVVAEVESTKTVSSVMAPVAGEVVSVNGDLETAPETVNSDCYGAGWLFTIAPSDPEQVDALMDEVAYGAYVEEISR